MKQSIWTLVKEVGVVCLKNTYAEDLAYIKTLIPHSEYDTVLSQFDCELDDSFIGFISQYRAISEFLPEDMIIIDLGCYLAAQSYLFQKFPKYIGTDGVSVIITFREG